jgi:hemerythrin-like domain-containing protein
MEAMEEPGEILRAEHEVILGLLTVLDPMAERLRGGAVIPERDLQDIVSIVADYADRRHDGKEEKVLFPRLASASPVERARLARRLTGTTRPSARCRKPQGCHPPADQGEGREEVAKLMEAYGRVPREHIRVEDEVLFPKIEGSPSFQERAEIARDFQRVEVEEVGEGVHEKYEGMVAALVASYARGRGEG